MEIKNIIEKLLTKEFPIGVGGCRNHDFRYDCCEYDITVFDEQWELQTLLSTIKEKKKQLFNADVKNCLVESQVCITKATNGL
ncbi:MAG TPA: hypothetical protein QGF01_04990, partial [Candidatus Nitrosopelagicus sp.]|nr:hypothetical protein [Candidatus Nitrosopelagicus sp.]